MLDIIRAYGNAYSIGARAEAGLPVGDRVADYDHVKPRIAASALGFACGVLTVMAARKVLEEIESVRKAPGRVVVMYQQAGMARSGSQIPRRNDSVTDLAFDYL
ncbi:hypothetical protein ACFL0V_03145 [Nanoarchaeota archaeon]